MSSRAVYGTGVRLSPRNLAVPFERAAPLPLDESYALTRRSRPVSVQVVSHSKRRKRMVKFDPEYDAIMRTSRVQGPPVTSDAVAPGDVVSNLYGLPPGSWYVVAVCEVRGCDHPTRVSRVVPGTVQNGATGVRPVPCPKGGKRGAQAPSRGTSAAGQSVPREVPREYLDVVSRVMPGKSWRDLSARQREAVRLYVEQVHAGLLVG